MKRYLIAIVVVLVLFFGFGFYKLKERKAQLQHLKPPAFEPFTVSVAKVKKGTLTVFENYRALYEPDKVAVLSPKVSGYVQKLFVKEGDSFKKGQVLALVDPTDLKSQLGGLEAKLQALKVALESAKTFYETQKLIYERNKRLYQTGGISKEQLQLSKSALEKAKAQLAEVEAQIRSTKAQIAALKHNIESYSKIVAPYDGKVDKILAREGSFVGTGHPIMQIEGTKLYRILVQVPKSSPVGKELKLAAGGKTITLTVSKVLPAAQNDLKVVEAYTKRLPLPSNSILSVELQTKRCGGFLVPFNSLLYLDSGTFVVNTKKEMVPVKVEAIYNSTACVKGNLKPGERVIVAGQYRLREIAIHKYPIRIKGENG
jgi:RND family efflux transporter MFP subunit